MFTNVVAGVVKTKGRKKTFGGKRTIDIRDPLHGYILVNELERKIIDTQPVQRLHYLRQLAGAYLVYPGADHTRFSHSLGVMHLAGEQLSLLQDKQGSQDDYQLAVVRIAGLLHDIGHGPFSHTFEGVLQKTRKSTHEDLTEWLIRTSEIGEILENEGIDKEDVAMLARGRKTPAIPNWMTQIISGPWDVDKMDFLKRDSHYTGADYGDIDIHRILFSTEIIEDQLMLDTTALFALESLLIARYEMFKAVYYHKTVRAAEIMLVMAMNLANNELGFTAFETPDQFLILNDGYVLSQIRKLRDAKDPPLRQASQIVNDLYNRRLLKVTGEKYLHVPDRFTAALYTKPAIKENLEREIAKLAGVDPEAIFIDIPTLPSLPYNPGALDPQALPVFEWKNGKRLQTSADRLSQLINVLRGFMDVIRCFTWDKYRKEVSEATAKVFDELPASAKISF